MRLAGCCGMPAADGVGERRHQGNAQAETNAHRPFTARSNVRRDFSYLYQRISQKLTSDVSGGDLENEIFPELSQAAVEQLVLLAGKIVAGFVRQLAIHAQATGALTRVRISQDRQDILAAAGDEVNIPAHPT